MSDGSLSCRADRSPSSSTDDTLADRDAAEAQDQLSKADLALALAGFRVEDIQEARANLAAAKGAARPN